MSASRVLVIDADALARWSLVEPLRALGHDVVEAATADAAEACLERGVDLVLASDAHAVVLHHVRETDPDVPVIVLTPRKTGPMPSALRREAFAWLATPVDPNQLALLIASALELAHLRRARRGAAACEAGRYGIDAVIGDGPWAARVRDLVRKAAAAPGPSIVITGERGTGKSLLARVLHHAGARRAQPCVVVSCTGRADALESTLFGHERGAFPGALRARRGALEVADGGTLVLDDVTGLPAALQARLLRFMDEGVFQRGGGSDVRADVQIVATTTETLDRAAETGVVRRDLSYRLSVVRIELPPLRDRDDDVTRLAERFVDEAARRYRVPVRSFSPEARAALREHDWPGNAHELRAVVDRVMIGGGAAPIDAPALLLRREAAAAAGPGAFVLPPDGIDLEELEKSLVTQALDRTGGNQTRAAALLALHRDQIRYRLGKFGLRTNVAGSSGQSSGGGS